MTARQAAPRVAILLILLGLALVSLRTSSRQKAEIARGDSIWQLTYAFKLADAKPGTQAHMSLPFDTPHCRIRNYSVSPKQGQPERWRPGRTKNREVTVAVPKQAAAPQGKPFEFGAEFEIHLSAQGVWRWPTADAKLNAEDRAAYLTREKYVQTDSAAVTETLDQIRLQAPHKSHLIEQIFEYCQTDLVPGGKEAPRDAEGALKQKVAAPLGCARAMVALCRAAKIPARLVTGFELKTGVNLQPHYWVEVLADNAWEPYDPQNGHAGELPRNFVPVRRDGVQIVHGKGIAKVDSAFSIRKLAPRVGDRAAEGRRPADILDLTRLPLESHEILSLFLLMPLGALVTAVFRTIVGIRTFGTFTPSLLALAFVYNDWQTGLIVFAVVLIVGFGSRSLLDRLRLLVVPRLSVILTLVVLCMVFAVSLWDYLGLATSAQSVMLPMVILTMTIERFYVSAEEDGLQNSLRLLAGTLILALCCYGILCWKAVGHVLLVYPEIHLLTIAALILLGRYSGYRLTELWRFRDLTQPRT